MSSLISFKPRKSSEFETQHPLDKRLNESQRILLKYPDRIPIIAELQKETPGFRLDKKKYLVPHDLTVGQFVYILRKRIKLEAESAIYLFINNTLPPASSLLSQLYKEHKNQDGFLYITVTQEATFGSV